MKTYHKLAAWYHGQMYWLYRDHGALQEAHHHIKCKINHWAATL